ncbi:hypothetical protein [Algivirga pacifica]|uniref:Gliding motility protein GldN n=1 Tax=Algivirga pacifica TaxID=1162670 RepID=A0ABP9D7C0_9BACT
MKHINYILFSLTFGLLSSTLSLGQEVSSSSYEEETNQHSINPIENYQVMSTVSLWIRMNLRAPGNEGFFTEDYELSKVIIDAVKNDRILPYKDDSFKERMSKEEFFAKLRIPQTELENDIANQASNDIFNNGTALALEEEDSLYGPRNVYLVDVKIERKFDRQRSSMYNDILGMTLIIPATETGERQVNIPVGAFSYRELYEQVFHQKRNGALQDNPEAIWFNNRNPAQNQNLGDAFALNFYQGRLLKYRSPRTGEMVDIEAGAKGYSKGEQIKAWLIDQENFLWEW